MDQDSQDHFVEVWDSEMNFRTDITNLGVDLTVIGMDIKNAQFDFSSIGAISKRDNRSRTSILLALLDDTCRKLNNMSERIRANRIKPMTGPPTTKG